MLLLSSLLLFVTLKLLIWVELKFLFQKIFGEKKSANAEHNKGMMLELICGFFSMNLGGKIRVPFYHFFYCVPHLRDSIFGNGKK